MHVRPSVGASVRVGPALERHPRPDLQLQGIRNPVTHPPCCSCGSAHALPSRVEPRAASFAVTRHSCSAALVSWYRVSLCVRSSDRGESRSAERRARMVVVCLGPFPIPRIAVWQLGVSTSVLLYCYTIAIVAYIHTGSCCWRGPTPKYNTLTITSGEGCL